MNENTQVVTEFAVNASVWAALISGIFGALIGTYFSTLLISYFNNRGVRKVRKICCDVLDILKKNGRYVSAKAQFNNAVTKSEKRAILVCLHKIGVPVANLNGSFDIDDVGFLDKEIVQEDIELMKSQVNEGMCDTYFFMDIDSYFNENIRLGSVRAVAKRYVDEVMRQQRMEVRSDSSIVFISVENWFRNFTPGELNAISTFREKTSYSYYFDMTTKMPIKESLDQLKREIDLGMWDPYLQWDYIAYQSMIEQKDMVVNFNILAKKQIFQQDFKNHTVQTEVNTVEVNVEGSGK